MLVELNNLVEWISRYSNWRSGPASLTTSDQAGKFLCLLRSTLQARMANPLSLTHSTIWDLETSMRPLLLKLGPFWSHMILTKYSPLSDLAVYPLIWTQTRHCTVSLSMETPKILVSMVLQIFLRLTSSSSLRSNSQAQPTSVKCLTNSTPILIPPCSRSKEPTRYYWFWQTVKSTTCKKLRTWYVRQPTCPQVLSLWALAMSSSLWWSSSMVTMSLWQTLKEGNAHVT